MRKRLGTVGVIVLGPCVVLLCLVIYYLWLAPPSQRYWADRWVNSPAYSPDGEKLAFSCHYPTLSQVWKRMQSLLNWGYISEATEICIIRIDGSELMRLTYNQAPDDYPSWSPDGKSIAYLSLPSHSAASTETHAVLKVMREDGRQLRKLAKSLDPQLERPQWSPTGRELSFAAEDPVNQDSGIDLYAVAVDSGRFRSLTALPGDEMGGRWSPDGTQLAFTWFPKGLDSSSKQAAIGIIDATGTIRVIEKAFVNIGGLSWSPDGTRLVFWGSLQSDCHDDDCGEVYVFDLLSNSVDSLTMSYGLTEIHDTMWSPDGKWIAFVARGHESDAIPRTALADEGPHIRGPAIYAVELDGRHLLEITTLGIHHAKDLSWAPDAKSMAFVVGIEREKWHIWFVQIEGGTVRRLRVS